MGEMIIFVFVMVFFIPFALKKKKRWKLAAPFFLLACLIIFHIGFFDRYSFLDSDLIFHKALVDTVIDASSFQQDAAIQYYLKTYPRGYHIILALLCTLKLSVAQISKFLGIILSLITPFLFYFLAREIYQNMEIAFFSGLFCGAASIGHTVYSGLPRSIGLVLFLAALLCLLRIRSSQLKISYIVVLNVIMVLLLFIHPYTFIVLCLVSGAFFLTMILQKKAKTGSLCNGYFLVFLSLLFYAVICWIFKQKNFIRLTSWDFLYEHRELYFDRVPYAFMNFFKLMRDVGILPLLMFICAFFNFLYKVEHRSKYPNLRFIFFAVLFLVFSTVAIMKINGLFFLKAHRFAPFISLLMYLSGIWVLKDVWSKIYHIKVIVPLYCLILLAPSAIDLKNHIQAPKFPYVLDRICVGISEPGKSRVTFNEILKLTDFIAKNIPGNEIIACSLELGDVLRMYSGRPVTASWQIGGMMTTFKGALSIYKEQMVNSEMLYGYPEQLYKRCGVRFFLFEKNKLTNVSEILTEFHVLWKSKNLYFCEKRG
ncbi:MAG: hypothetical protein L6416_08455 [Candidatus Omnitrophica bacterium]|nr:hypothetical protein [Candidatus Omnitrophota bacterium]